MSGIKYDAGKDPWHLLPYDAIAAIVKILAFGANKYAERNWEAGMDWGRVFSALQRHLSAWWQGEKQDAETGYSHLWHAGCCILFLIAFEIRGIGKDDRPDAVVPAPEKDELAEAQSRLEKYFSAYPTWNVIPTHFVKVEGGSWEEWPWKNGGIMVDDGCVQHLKYEAIKANAILGTGEIITWRADKKDTHIRAIAVRK